MRYRLFGNTGLRVSELCLGAMVFGDTRGTWGASQQDAARIVEAFAAAGGNFIDTANYYAGGESERIVGEVTRSERDRWVLASKYACSMRRDDPNAGGSHRKSFAQALDGSLERLGCDYIDIYWVHIWDPLTPVEEVLRCLDDAVRAGKVLYTGISDTPAWIVSHAVAIADERRWTRFAGLQVPYSLVERTVERELLPMARQLDLGITTWSPLADGLLSGRYGSGRPQPADSRVANVAGYRLSERNLAIADAVNEVAATHGATAAQTAIAWIRSRQARGVIIPMIGARTPAQIKENLLALSLELSVGDLERLERASAIELGFPHDFGATRLAYGDTRDLIDDHRDPRSVAA